MRLGRSDLMNELMERVRKGVTEEKDREIERRWEGRKGK